MKQLLTTIGNVNLLNQIHIEWEIDTDEDLSLYNIQITKANSPNEIFNIIDTVSIDTVSWDDIQSNIHLLWNESYYKLQLYDESNTYVFPDIININPKPKPEVLEMERRLRLLLKLKNGVECWFLKRKHVGVRCTECWNASRGVKTETNCVSCYDTAFIGGYYKAIPGYVNLVSIDDFLRKRIFGNETVDATIMYTARYCILQPKDIVVVKDTNQRFEIISNEHAELVGWKYPSQYLTVQLLERKHVIYKKVIDV